MACRSTIPERAVSVSSPGTRIPQKLGHLLGLRPMVTAGLAWFVMGGPQPRYKRRPTEKDRHRRSEARESRARSLNNDLFRSEPKGYGSGLRSKYEPSRGHERAVIEPTGPLASKPHYSSPHLSSPASQTSVASNRSTSGVGRPLRCSADCSCSARERISSGAARVCAANHSSPRGLARTRRQ